MHYQIDQKSSSNLALTKYIWMTDVRDTLFQRDPFDLFLKQSSAEQVFHVFQEGGFTVIGDD